jgi:hypothetical protein
MLLEKCAFGLKIFLVGKKGSLEQIFSRVFITVDLVEGNCKLE